MRLVLGGDPAALGEGDAPADYLKANTGAHSRVRLSARGRRGRERPSLLVGVMLLRVHNWTLSLLRRMLSRGGRTRGQRLRRALNLQTSVANLCTGCIDDQAVLLDLLRSDRLGTGALLRHALLERRFLLQALF